LVLDCLLTFDREIDLHPDPGLELVVGAGVVRNSAFLFGVRDSASCGYRHVARVASL
jgi:hypothetical protein